MLGAVPPATASCRAGTRPAQRPADAATEEEEIMAEDDLAVRGRRVATAGFGPLVPRGWQAPAAPVSGRLPRRTPLPFTLPQGAVPHGSDAAPRLQTRVPG